MFGITFFLYPAPFFPSTILHFYIVLSPRKPSVGAWEKNKLIGFARAISDGIFRAYIEDVVISSSFNRKGIGIKLIAKMVDELSNIDVISLFCEEDLISFYNKNEFKKSNSQFVMHKVKK
ncbi:GNAT family acetyltransferase [Niallia circulans]|jgi:ribosomal protein S18 acetylase RimI-like enzyme|uniref:GNAT family N-acetyltransferase n=1 Tax=Niallia TaxID=2837506 RepID=UPI00069EF587|nr:GNAT family N-acetyltransferase [Niallia circulans]MDR4314522.1 GNAT family N-acetyltransferase [Niallia circulans]MED3841386.1 GNAT family N-acetyltransferase [Niallia circulans]MED4242683.1 GNAT family N-acetyltransferase [Niallia circulans]MED4246661.1 GNAT family N-acetyltransferase [Niallia circulans]MED5101456.1 GNAT family N-acetyltransferase [Niallia circulans]